MSRCGALVAGLLCLLGAALVRAEDVISQWDAAFPTRDAPQQVYFRAGYHDDVGRTHRLEVWREADLRLRRRTDEAIDLYVEKSGSGEYEYRLIDHDRKILIRADRTTLYRIGVFSDWIGLAHVLKVPRGGYRVTEAARQSPAPGPFLSASSSGRPSARGKLRPRMPATVGATSTFPVGSGSLRPSRKSGP